MIMITKAGTIRECIFDDMYQYACNVVDGTFNDDSFLPVLYELDAKEEWRDPKKWKKANPALGTIKKVDDLIRKVERAKNNPNDLNGLLVKDFNIRDTLHSAWLSFDDINNEETFNIEDFRGVYAIGEALQTFSEEIQSNISCANDPRETLNYYDYEQLARQVFYMVDDFRANIIKYLESQAK